MKKKIAVYAGEFCDHIFELGEHKTVEEMDSLRLKTGNVRVTEYIDVDFPDLSQETVVSAQITAIDAVIAEKTASMIIEINKLKERKSELLAICFDGDL